MSKVRKSIGALTTVIALTMSMLAGLLPAGEIVAYADDSKAIVLVDNGVASNISGAQASSVYFGNYQQSSNGSGGYTVEPIKWRVLQNNTTNKTLFLLSDQNLDAKEFDTSSPLTNVWANCTLRKWLNGSGSVTPNFINTAFDSREIGAIAPTANVSATDTDKIFLLSVEEAEKTDYGFTGNASLTSTRVAVNTAYVASINTSMSPAGEADIWWLRSPGLTGDFAALVNNYGLVDTTGNSVDYYDVAVRPALNINLSSIILTSAAEGGKISGTTGADSLKEVNAYTGNEWKLTVNDRSRDGSGKFTAKRTDRNTLARGAELKISYSGAVTGSDKEFVSAIITNAAGTVLYYGHIASTETSASGTATINIPTDAPDNMSKLYVFQEQCNGNYKTDYSSKLHDLTEPATKETPTADDFDVTLPNDLVYDGNVKEATATVKSGITGMGTVTVNYYKDGTKLPGAPKDIGTYTVKLDVVEGEGYTSAHDLTKDSWKFTITDSPVAVTGVTVSPEEIELRPGDSKTLTKTIEPDNATNKNVEWSSNKPDVAKVDNNGKVTAIDEGEALITVTTEDGNWTATCKVTVKKDAPVVEECTITFDPNGGKGEMDPQKGDKGDTVKLKANEFTRNGYSFKNWNTKADGSGVKYDDKQSVKLETDMTLYAQWKKGKSKPESDDEDDNTEEPDKPAVVNPDTVEGYFMVGGQIVPNVLLGKMKQGEAAQMLFDKTGKAGGWLEAFTFNMAIDGKYEYTLKNGILTIIIPKEYRKAGRIFALMGLDKNANVVILNDTDTNPDTLTVNLNIEGYAFDLIYKD